MNSKIFTAREIIIELWKAKAKEKTLKTAREKLCIKYIGTIVRLSTHFSSETMETRRQCYDIFKVLGVGTSMVNSRI